MKKRHIVFIASKEYDNLGIGYMSAILSAAGYKTSVIDFKETRTEILRILTSLKPQLVGFSVIFQYHIDHFVNLIEFLRSEGINSHFTAGGHYASLKHEELFDFIPCLDSIVRFEGENTILELANCIYNGSDWRKLKGLAFRKDRSIITNPIRPFEKDLDKFPFPLRANLKEYAIGKKCTTIIAGRGCVHNCTFCNAREFYKNTPGLIKRIRKPEMVADEIELLYHIKHCSVFLFVDDDFPVNSVKEPKWVIRFCNELKQRRLGRKIMWHICCRPDEVEEELFVMMKENGLFSVFLGLEDGTDAGLKRLNKRMSINKSLNGINILKKLRINIDFGFMLFQPYSTFSSITDNLNFLRQILSDGYAPVTFLKMMPYYETQIEKELIKEGRLKISNGTRDYDFRETWMNEYYKFTCTSFMKWLRHPDGLENTSHWTRNHFSVYLYYFDYFNNDVLKLFRKFTRIISESNIFLLNTMDELASFFKSGQYKRDNDALDKYERNIDLKHDLFLQNVHGIMNELMLYAEICR